MSLIIDKPLVQPTSPCLGPEQVPARRSAALADVPAGLTLRTLPDRDLDADELTALAVAVARDERLWAHEVAFSNEQRHYASLHRDAHVDVWVLCWTPQNDTGWHDHDISSGAVAVVRGTLTEHNLAIGAPLVHTDVPAGRVFSFGPEHIHRLTGRDAGSVSIHAYSPPLWRMGQYAITSTGVLRRISVSYADELRPLDDLT
ncbi:MAG: cysteine dioxygenase family protein [Micrococcales bacterium]|nr:cysteine dioxygenase family protein [Micrococcales bacterium]